MFLFIRFFMEYWLLKIIFQIYVYFFVLLFLSNYFKYNLIYAIHQSIIPSLFSRNFMITFCLIYITRYKKSALVVREVVNEYVRGLANFRKWLHKLFMAHSSISPFLVPINNLYSQTSLSAYKLVNPFIMR